MQSSLNQLGFMIDTCWFENRQPTNNQPTLYQRAIQKKIFLQSKDLPLEILPSPATFEKQHQIVF